MSLQGEMHSMVPKVWTAMEAGPNTARPRCTVQPKNMSPLRVVAEEMFLHAEWSVAVSYKKALITFCAHTSILSVAVRGTSVRSCRGM
jgi:hypothetical protein